MKLFTGEIEILQDEIGKGVIDEDVGCQDQRDADLTESKSAKRLNRPGPLRNQEGDIKALDPDGALCDPADVRVSTKILEEQNRNEISRSDRIALS